MMQNSIKKEVDRSKLFTFAVITDTHINQREMECNSPFAVNRLANERMRYVVGLLNSQKELAFTMHLGDLIHPVPEMKNLYSEAAGRFCAQISSLRSPIYLAPGNHDVGDKPVDWSPARKVSDEYIDLWTKTFGNHYYSFDHEGCHFSILNAQILNSGLASEREQRIWFEDDLRRNSGKRSFIFLHYPPFICHDAESENYDNIAEPARAWLLSMLSEHNVEALFAGHVHNFWYNRYLNTKCYLVPSTSFVRQDYSEMFKVPPPEAFELGRNDTPKLGYFLVHVFDNGHKLEFIRTNGLTTDQESTGENQLNLIYQESHSLGACHNIGFDLRESWADRIGIPPSGGLDEFDRKDVRNDYPLLALMEMGVQNLRIPMQDLRSDEGCRRVSDLKELGFEFTVFSFGIPTPDDLLAMENSKHLLSSWEVCVSVSQLGTLAEQWSRISERLGLPTFISLLGGNEQHTKTPKTYYHFIRHGFSPEDDGFVQNITSLFRTAPHFSGLVFRIDGGASVYQSIGKISTICHKYGINGSVHMKMSSENPAEPKTEELWASNRIAAAMFSAVSNTEIRIFVDTLIDVDRGYFARKGVIDRLCNPHMGARVFKNLQAALAKYVGCGVLSGHGVNDSGEWIEISGDNHDCVLFLPEGNEFNANLSVERMSTAGSIKLIMLDSGREIDLDPNDVPTNDKIAHLFETSLNQPFLIFSSTVS